MILAAEAKVKNRVLLTLLVLMVVTNLCLPLLTDAPNRLISGQGISLYALLDSGGAWFLLPFSVLAAVPFAPPARRTHLLAALSAALLLGGFSLLAGHTAQRLAGGDDSLIRI